MLSDLLHFLLANYHSEMHSSFDFVAALSSFCYLTCCYSRACFYAFMKADLIASSAFYRAKSLFAAIAAAASSPISPLKSMLLGGVEP